MTPLLFNRTVGRGCVDSRPHLSGWISLIIIMSLVIPAAAAGAGPSGHLVWASNRMDGRHEIYRSNADGTDVTRLTQAGGKMATWSPDGRWIAYYTPDDTTRVMRWDGSDDHEIFHGIPAVPDAAAVPHFWMFDNSGLVTRDEHTFYLVNPETAEATQLFTLSEITSVANNIFVLTSISRDNQILLGFTDLYHYGHPDPAITYTGNNAVVAIERQDPGVAWFIGPGCEPTFSPTEDVLFHVFDRQNSHANPLAVMPLADYKTRASHSTFLSFENEEWGHQYFPRPSNDGRWLVYSASTGCQNHQKCDYDVFLHDLAGPSDNRTRIIEHAENDQWPHLRVGEPFPLDRKLHLSRRLIKITAGVDGIHSSPSSVELFAWNQASLPQEMTVILDPVNSAAWLHVEPIIEQGRVSLTWTIDPTGLTAGLHRQVARLQLDGISHPALSLEFELDLFSPLADTPIAQQTPGSCSLIGQEPRSYGAPLAMLMLLFLLLGHRLRRRHH